MSRQQAAIPHPAGRGWVEAQIGARAFSPGSSPVKLMGGSMVAADVVVVLACSFIAFAVRHGAVLVPPEIVSITLLAAVLAANVFRMAGCYRRLVTASAMMQVGRVVQGWSIVFVSLLILAYATKTSDEFSRVWAVGWFFGALAGLTAVRLWCAGRVRHWRRIGKLARTIAIVDVDGRGNELARRLKTGSEGEMHLVGVFSAQPCSPGQSGINELIGLSRLFRIDDVVVATSNGDGGNIDAVMARVGTIPTNVRLSPMLPPMTVAPREASFLFGQPMLTIYSRPLGDWARVTKRTEDLVLSTIGIVLIAPLLAVIAIAIKLDSPGPMLFRQFRLGFNNNVITVYKFRTMTHRPDDHDVVQAQRHDPRVTRIGRFLRRSSLDELPQLFNVLRGDMSLVGPRPHALAHNDQYAALIDGYLGRHRVQPGITGWAQVNGLRGETDTLDKMQRRVEHDLAYTDEWSLALDLKILVMTVFTALTDRNAY